MDLLEQKFVNSPIKKIMLRFFELSTFKKFLDAHAFTLQNKTILDAGCGSGYGLKVLYSKFLPKKLYGIDILPAEVLLARKQKIPATILLNDIVHTSFPSESFDAVFIFTVLHHIVEWRDGLKEIARILKPGGLFFVDELNKNLVHMFKIMTGVKHPESAQFQWNEFVDGLHSAGFRILNSRILPVGFGLFLCEKIKQ